MSRSIGRPLRAELSRSALRHNYALARQKAAAARVFAVVKANAYGHGLEWASRVLSDADGFALLELDAAEKLRAMGLTQPILMLEGFFDTAELPLFSRHHLISVIHDIDRFKALTQAELAVPIDVFLKFNTGMNRLGLQGPLAGFALHGSASHRNIGAVGLMTHFATADEERGLADQLARFDEIVKSAQPVLGKKGFTQSLANSAALLRFPESHRDWVRPGLMLYGSSPFATTSAEKLGLKPVMTLRSEVIAVQTLTPGEIVGYGATFKATRRMRIGIVAGGYADGYPRHAPGGNVRGTPVLVSGAHTRTIGRVSMDTLAVDLTDLPHAHVGAPVTLWGEGIPADDVARAADTVAYELFCAVSARVPMVEVD